MLVGRCVTALRRTVVASCSVEERLEQHAMRDGMVSGSRLVLYSTSAKRRWLRDERVQKRKRVAMVWGSVNHLVRHRAALWKYGRQ